MICLNYFQCLILSFSPLFDQICLFLSFWELKLNLVASFELPLAPSVVQKMIVFYSSRADHHNYWKLFSVVRYYSHLKINILSYTSDFALSLALPLNNDLVGYSLLCLYFTSILIVTLASQSFLAEEEYLDSSSTTY
jgi:hypothetical protein